MAWTTATTRATGYTVTAAVWNAEHVGNMNHLTDVALATYTADVTVNATAVGSANQIVAAPSVTVEAVPHMLEFYCPHYSAPAQQTRVVVRASTTVLGTVARIGVSISGPVYACYYFTPTSGTRTYNIAAWLAGAGTGTMNAGTGGTAGDDTTDLNGFIRIRRVPV